MTFSGDSVTPHLLLNYTYLLTAALKEGRGSRSLLETFLEAIIQQGIVCADWRFPPRIPKLSSVCLAG